MDYSMEKYAHQGNLKKIIRAIKKIPREKLNSSDILAQKNVALLAIINCDEISEIQFQIVHELLKNMEDIGLRCRNIFYDSIKNNHLKMVKLLIGYDKSFYGYDATKCKTIESAFYLAAKYGRLEIAIFLKENKFKYG